MELLNAYWRMDYIQEADGPGEGSRREDVFLDLPRSGDDRAALIVHRAEHLYIVLNRYPYNPGHLLIVPYTKQAALDALPEAARLELVNLIVRAQQVLTQAMQPDGFNIGMNLGRVAGAGIPDHLHLHIVPRWNGDSNFLPVIGKTRTLPQALDQTWEALQDLFARA